MVVEKFQILGVKITGKYISNSPPDSYYYIPLQAEGNYPFPRNNVLLKSIFPEQKGGRIMKVKK